MDNKFSIPLFEHKPFVYADEWAEQNMYLRETGKFSYDVTPYLKLPTRCASDLIECCRVVIMCPAQAGKSSAMVNIICHSAIYHPSNTLIIMDTLKNAQRMSKNRLKPALRDYAHVASLQRGARVLDKSAESMNISLGSGANLILGTSSSASDLCSTPVRILLLDELDRFQRDLSGEGDPVTLALKRQLRFKDSMAVLTSTPTTPDGAISRHFALGTQEVWGVVCECGRWLNIEYGSISFDSDTPVFTCPYCGEVYSEKDIEKLHHEYKPFNDHPYQDARGRLCRSFRFSSTLMHGIYTWEQIRREEIQATSLGEAAIRSFKNTTLGEAYLPKNTEIKDYNDLLKYRLAFNKNSIPSFVTEIFAGIDTQDSWFEVVIIGCDKTSSQIAFIEHKQIIGDLDQGSTWERLKQYINEFTCKTQDGRTLNINLVCQDAGGHYYNEVLSLGLLSPLWRAVRGRSYAMSQPELTVIDKVKRTSVKNIGYGAGKVDITYVNTRYTKDLIFSKLSLMIDNKDSGLYFSSSPDAGIDENLFEQLTSEVKQVSGSGIEYYVKKNSFRNECLDCTVYALAASELYRLAMCRLPSLSLSHGVGEDNESSIDNSIKTIQINTSTQTPINNIKEIYKHPITQEQFDNQYNTIKSSNKDKDTKNELSISNINKDDNTIIRKRKTLLKKL